MHVLILGGTAEARALAAALDEQGYSVQTSLAGRVRQPRLPDGGEVRVGGFGGVSGLAQHLQTTGVQVVVDATHPFAATISANAAAACAQVGVPRLVVRRPGYTQRAGDHWIRVDSVRSAADTAARLGRRIFVTTGRQGLGEYAHLRDHYCLVRCVEHPTGAMPPHADVLLDRGPFTVAGEIDLISGYGIEVVTTKDSGGEMTSAKLAAARELGLPVVVVNRPPHPQGPLVTSVAEAAAWVHDTLALGVG